MNNNNNNWILTSSQLHRGHLRATKLSHPTRTKEKNKNSPLKTVFSNTQLTLCRFQKTSAQGDNRWDQPQENVSNVMSDNYWNLPSTTLPSVMSDNQWNLPSKTLPSIMNDNYWNLPSKTLPSVMAHR